MSWVNLLKYKIFRLFIFIIFSFPINAEQQDLEIPSINPHYFFNNSENGFLFKNHSKLEVAKYLFNKKYHQLHGKLTSSIGFFKFNELLLIRSGLTMQTVADGNNEINFRLIRLYYDFYTTLEKKIDEKNLIYFAYRHKCSHGADSALVDRILIRSGPELGFKNQIKFNNNDLWNEVFIHFTLIGQNQDRNYQAKLLLAIQQKYIFNYKSNWSLFFAGGSGFSGWTKGKNEIFYGFKKLNKTHLNILPTVATGFIKTNAKSKFEMGIYYQVNQDHGIGLLSEKNNNLIFKMIFSH